SDLFQDRAGPCSPHLSLHDALPISVHSGFSRYFSEGDINADLACELRSQLPEELVEIHLELATAGSGKRGYPDLSVIPPVGEAEDRKSTRLNSSHRTNSYAVFCLKK